MIISAIAVAGLIGASAAGVMAKSGRSGPARLAAANSEADDLESNLLKDMHIRADVRAFGKSLNAGDDALLKWAKEGHDFVAGLSKDKLNRKMAPSIRKFRDTWAEDGKSDDILGEDNINLGQDLSDSTSNAAMAGFPTATCTRDDDHVASLVDVTNSSINYLIIGMYGGWYRDGGNKFTNEQMKHFVKQNVVLMDGIPLRCEKTDAVPKGNKIHVTEAQMKRKAYEHGVEGKDRMLLWALISATNLAFHVAYRYAMTDGKEPLNLLLACIRNVEFLFDFPDYEFVVSDVMNVANCPHPECCSVTIANGLVHPLEKLARYARNIELHLQKGYAGLHMPDKDGIVRESEETLAKLPTEGKVKYFHRKAKKLNMTEADMEAEREFLRAASKKAGDASAKKALDGNEVMNRLILEDEMTFEDAKEVVLEGSFAGFWRSLEAFKMHFDIAKAEFKKHAVEVKGQKVVILPTDEWFGPDGDRVRGKASNNYFRDYSGDEFENDWRRVLFRKEGIDKYSEGWRMKMDASALDREENREARRNPEADAEYDAETNKNANSPSDEDEWEFMN